MTFPNAMLKYSSAAIVPVPPRPTMYATSRPANCPADIAAASTPSTMAICAPSTEPSPTARNVFTDEVELGR
ncbi:hypothetical protein D3C81_2064400 [compost metagenome]